MQQTNENKCETYREKLKRLRLALKKAKKDGLVTIGYNIAYEIKILQQEHKRNDPKPKKPPKIKVKKKKKPPRKTLQNKLTRIFNKYIVKRDKSVCVICGTTEKPTCGHFFSATNLSTRRDEDNCHCQCSGCNMRHEYDPYPYTKRMQEEYGIEFVDKLHAKRYQSTIYKKPTLEKLENDILYYENLIASD